MSGLGESTRRASFDLVVKNLNNAIAKIGAQSMAGLIRAAALVRNSTELYPPLVPVDKGFLRNSWQSHPIFYKNRPVVICGYTANYAVFVHENVGATFQRDGAGAKWFEAAIKREEKNILEIIREEAKI